MKRNRAICALNNLVGRAVQVELQNQTFYKPTPTLVV